MSIADEVCEWRVDHAVAPTQVPSAIRELPDEPSATATSTAWPHSGGIALQRAPIHETAPQVDPKLSLARSLSAGTQMAASP